MQTRSIIISIGLLVLLLAPPAFAGNYSFIDDFLAFDRQPGWGPTSYRDLEIDANDTVTVFFEVDIHNSTYNQNYQEFFRCFDKFGNAVSPTMMISDSSLYQVRSNLNVGYNRAGKWVLCNKVRYNCSDWPFCDEQLRAWVSSANGSEVDTEIIVGDELDQQYRHTNAATAVDSAGNFVICWGRNSTGDSLYEGRITYQLFYPDGAKRTPPLTAAHTFLPDSSEMGDKRYPKVAMTPGGDFVIVWQAFCSGPSCQPPDLSDPKVFMRLFHDDGTPKTDVMRADDVRYEQPIPALYPDVAIADDGRFAVSYSRTITPCGVVEHTMLPAIKRFDAESNALGAETILDSITCVETPLISTAVVSDADFNLLVSWQNNNTGAYDGTFMNIMAQRIDNEGNLRGVRYQINDNSNWAIRLNSVCAVNDKGLAGFFWNDIRDGSTQDFIQLMDYSQVGLYIAGDVDNNTTVSIGDAVFLINYIFGGGYSPATTCIADANGDDVVSIGDAVTLINYIFAGGKIDGDCGK